MNFNKLPPMVALRSFAAFAELGSVSAVCDALGLPNGQVHQHLSAIEAHIGARLFERSQKQFALNQNGKELGEVVLSGLFSIINAIDLASGNVTETTLCVTTPHAFAFGWLANRMGGFEKANPSFRIMMNPRLIGPSYRCGDDELVIRAGQSDSMPANARLLVRSNLCIVASNDLIDANKSAANKALPLVVDTSFSDANEWLQSSGFLNRHGGDLIEVPDQDVLPSIRAGRGFGVVDRIFIEDDLRKKRLRLLSEISSDRGYYLITNERIISPAVQAFLGWIKDQFDGSTPKQPAQLTAPNTSAITASSAAEGCKT